MTDREDPPSFPKSPGYLLRSLRRQHNMTIADMADALHLRGIFLERMESDMIEFTPEIALKIERSGLSEHDALWWMFRHAEWRLHKART